LKNGRVVNASGRNTVARIESRIMKVVVSGASGLIGRSLAKELGSDGHDVVRLVRREPQGPNEIEWDPRSGTIDTASLEGADVVFHLAGAGIGDRRWTESYKQEILDSRVIGTALLASTLASLERKPSVLISASAIGWYGDRGADILNETAAKGDGFLADVTEAWETAAAPAASAGIRVVHPRTGIVLSKDGGALQRLLLPFKLGAGGRTGPGSQWWSWITLDDEVRALTHLAASSEMAGPVNLTAPNPVTNTEFVKTLGGVLRRPTVLPTPSFVLKAMLGAELADALLFQSQRVVPARLTEDGFAFGSPSLEGALQTLIG
jgi:uncharacterized protein (TIGR01777 family)